MGQFLRVRVIKRAPFCESKGNFKTPTWPRRRDS